MKKISCFLCVKTPTPGSLLTMVSIPRIGLVVLVLVMPSMFTTALGTIMVGLLVVLLLPSIISIPRIRGSSAWAKPLDPSLGTSSL